MKLNRYVTYYPGLFTLLAFCLTACDKMDATYQEYIKNTVYIGKVDSVQVHPGTNRIKLSFQLAADPKISRVKVYWNDRTDSAEKVIQRIPGNDVYELMLNDLSERAYSFEIFTYDAEGNSSIKVTASGSSYGENYQSTLSVNRSFTEAVLIEDGLSLNWSAAEENAVVVALKYTDNSGTLRTVYVPSTESQTVLEDYRLGTTFEYHTGYLPEVLAIDTIYTIAGVVSDGIIDITPVYLKNHTQPFQYSDYDGTRWGTLKDWTVNAAARNQGPADNKIYGGIDNLNNSSSLALSRYNADPNIPNGKVYQTITLPAGKYDFSWTTVGNSAGANAGTDPRFIVVAAGNTLPDVADIATALVSETFVGKNTAVAPFTLDQPTEVSVGILVDWTGGNSAFRAHRVQLIVYPAD